VKGWRGRIFPRVMVNFRTRNIFAPRGQALELRETDLRLRAFPRTFAPRLKIQTLGVAGYRFGYRQRLKKLKRRRFRLSLSLFGVLFPQT
jgi:hypothetical protein